MAIKQHLNLFQTNKKKPKPLSKQKINAITQAKAMPDNLSALRLLGQVQSNF